MMGNVQPEDCLYYVADGTALEFIRELKAKEQAARLDLDEITRAAGGQWELCDEQNLNPVPGVAFHFDALPPGWKEHNWHGALPEDETLRDRIAVDIASLNITKTFNEACWGGLKEYDARPDALYRLEQVGNAHIIIVPPARSFVDNLTHCAPDGCTRIDYYCYLMLKEEMSGVKKPDHKVIRKFKLEPQGGKG